MRLTPRRLNRATLARQLLLEREPLDVLDAVHRIVAIQAQEAASPYVALWNRVAGFDPAALDRAFADHDLVKASLMRITLHAVLAMDYGPFHAAMQRSLRASRLGDPRFTIGGVTIAETDALLPRLAQFIARPRTSSEVEAWFEEQVGADARRPVWWAVRTFGPLLHEPIGGPWSFGHRRTFLAAATLPSALETNAPTMNAAPGEPAINTLVRRYLEGFGPASARDVAQFSMIGVPTAREALLSIAGSLVTYEGPDGGELFDVPGGPVPAEETPAPPRLMAMWDSVLLAHADRGRIIPPDYRAHVTRRNGDVLPTLLVDGYVAGVWRPIEGGIEATAFHPLPDEAWQGLETEARALVALLADRQPAIYSRYGRWWKSLPTAEVRVLAGGPPG